MARHIEGWDHFNSTRLRGLQNLEIVGTTQVTIHRRVPVRAGAELGQDAPRLGRIVAAVSAYFGEFRKARDLQPPPFIVTEVKVQFVELVPAHLIDELQQLRFAVEVACQIDVQSAKGQARCVFDRQRTKMAAVTLGLLR